MKIMATHAQRNFAELDGTSISPYFTVGSKKAAKHSKVDTGQVRTYRRKVFAIGFATRCLDHTQFQCSLFTKTRWI